MSKRKSGADEAPAAPPDGACAVQRPSALLPLTRLPAATLGAVSAAGLDAVLSRAHAKRGRTAAAPGARHAALPAPRALLAATALGACGAPAQSRAGYEAEGELRPSDEERCDGAAQRATARTRHAR
jgi:hypothetical protein